MDHPENSEEYKGLQVNAGVTSQSIVNPYLKRGRFRRHEYSAAEMVEGILKGDVTILSQAVTLVESVNPNHYAKRRRSSTSVCLIVATPCASVSVACQVLVRVRRLTSLAFMCWNARAANWLSWPSTLPASAARVVFLATRRVWRSFPSERKPSSVLRQRLVLSVA